MVAGAVSIEWAAPASMRAASSNCRAAQASSEQKSKKRRHRQFGLREKERERGLRACEQVGESGRAEAMGVLDSIMVPWTHSYRVRPAGLTPRRAPLEDACKPRLAGRARFEGADVPLEAHELVARAPPTRQARRARQRARWTEPRAPIEPSITQGVERGRLAKWKAFRSPGLVGPTTLRRGRSSDEHASAGAAASEVRARGGERGGHAHRLRGQRLPD